MTAASRAGAGTTNEHHWSERAAALLAPLLYAAQLTDRPIEEVLSWTLRQDLAPALEVLADSESKIPADMLVGIERTDARERSIDLLRDRRRAQRIQQRRRPPERRKPQLRPRPLRRQAPTRSTSPPRAAPGGARGADRRTARADPPRRLRPAPAPASAPDPGMLWLLDEVANIAPIHDLPALVSQAGGQNLQVVIGLQDLSQARTRWGADAADGCSPYSKRS